MALKAHPGGHLFKDRCEKCHGADGTGNKIRSLLSAIPDFTSAPWQAQRSDPQLLSSIVNGKGSGMPPQRGKTGEDEVRSLVAYVRAFAPPQGNAVRVNPEALAQSQTRDHSFDKRQAPAPEESQVRTVSATSYQRSLPPRSTPESPSRLSVEESFKRQCAKCHGVDGTGSRVRSRNPEIPDFTDASWQAKRTNAELTESILKGKGAAMPPADDDVGEEQARALVAHVRGFARTLSQPKQEEQEGRVLAPIRASSKSAELMQTAKPEPPDAESPLSFVEKLTRWLGRSHPPTVHFPIALLTAAAVAELLRLATRKPIFDPISRYCVAFGTLTAMLASTLGWCAGSFRLTDASWVLTTHRWLGTSMTVCTGWSCS